MFILSQCHVKLLDMFCLAGFSKSANFTQSNFEAPAAHSSN